MTLPPPSQRRDGTEFDPFEVSLRHVLALKATARWERAKGKDPGEIFRERMGHEQQALLNASWLSDEHRAYRLDLVFRTLSEVLAEATPPEGLEELKRAAVREIAAFLPLDPAFTGFDEGFA